MASGNGTKCIGPPNAGRLIDPDCRREWHVNGLCAPCPESHRSSEPGRPETVLAHQPFCADWQRPGFCSRLADTEPACRNRTQNAGMGQLFRTALTYLPPASPSDVPTGSMRDLRAAEFAPNTDIPSEVNIGRNHRNAETNRHDDIRHAGTSLWHSDHAPWQRSSPQQGQDPSARSILHTHHSQDGLSESGQVEHDRIFVHVNRYVRSIRNVQ